MTRVLVAWEDEHFQGLQRLVARHLARQTVPEGDALPVVMHHTVRGNGRFQHYVADTWTNIRSKGLPGNAGPIDHLVCVIDGDKLSELHRAIPPCPGEAEQVPAWHVIASGAWRALLRSWVAPSVPSESVYGIVLRWSRESAILAGYDLPPFQDRLGITADHPEVVQLLKRECSPAPNGVPAGAFTDTWQRPMRCLERLFRAQGLSKPGKSDPVFDDVLRDCAQAHLGGVIARMPDLDALVRWTLAPLAAPEEPSSAAVAPKGRRKSRRA